MNSITFEAYRSFNLQKAMKETSARSEDQEDSCDCIGCAVGEHDFDESTLSAKDKADFLHDIYCCSYDCDYDAEDEELANPWSGPDHVKWLRIWGKLAEKGVSFKAAVDYREEVFEMM